MSNHMRTALPWPDNILRKAFSNGITVLIHENPVSSTAAVCGSVFAGSCLDPLGKTGLSAFVSAALTAGTRSGDFAKISGFLENIGAVLSFDSAPHSIGFNGNCLSEDLPDLLGLLKEILAEPVFPEYYLDVLRKRALGGFELDMDTSDTRADRLFRNVLWTEDHPYGRLRFDSEEFIRSITRDNLTDFHERFFGPKKLILALAGGFCGEKVMDLCEKIFGSWEKTQENVDEDSLFPRITRIDAIVRRHIEIESEKEISLVIGTFGPAAGDPDLLSAKLGNCILGEFGMNGRMGRAVRDEHGLAYSVRSSLNSWKKGGSWSVSARTDPANLEKAGELILDELSRFTHEPVSPKELADTKSWYIGSIPLEFGTNTEKASALHNLAFYERDLDYYLRLRERVEAITPEMILATAQKWIDPNKVVITTLGHKDESKEQGWW